MFKFSTTHVINNGTNVEARAFNKDTGALIVDFNNVIKFDTIQSIQRALPKAGASAQITLDVAKYIEDNPAVKTFRLYVYLRTVNNADPLFANDFVFKGKPFYLEFDKVEGTITDAEHQTQAGVDAVATVTALAERINTPSSNVSPFFFGTKLVTAEVNGSNYLVLKVESDNYDLRFHTIKLEGKVAAESAGVTAAYVGDEFFKNLAVWNAGEGTGNFVKNTIKGNTGFGTYEYLLHNLRLPTNANLRFYRDQQGELPVKGANYIQYIFKTLTERPEMQGTSVLGQYNQSVTTHIFWVDTNLKSTFEGAIEAASKTVGESTNIKGQTVYVLPVANTTVSNKLDFTGSDNSKPKEVYNK